MCDKLQAIPSKFNDVSDWVEKFRPYVIEEVHASLLKELSSEKYFEAKFTLNATSIPKRVEMGPTTLLLGSIDSKAFSLLNMNDAPLDTEETDEQTDPSESTVMSFLGIFSLKTPSTSRTCIDSSTKIIVAKVMVINDPKQGSNTDEETKNNCSILINRQIWQEEVEAYGDSRDWSLFFLPSCLISPSENIDRALNEVSLLQENPNLVLQQMMKSVFTEDEGELELAQMNQLIHTSGSLNEHQDKAVQKVLLKMMSPSNSLSSIQLIHGPPGTGKSSTLVSIIRGLLMKKNHVLVTAPTNFAVCELAGRSLRNLPLDFPMHQIVLHGSKTRLKLDNELEKIHLSSRISRLIKAIRRWEGHRRSILTSPDETTQLVLDECIDDLTVIFLDCPASLLSDRERQSVKNCLDCLTQTRSRELISDLKPLEENFYYVLFHVSISDEVFDTLKAEILFSATLVFSTVSVAASLRFMQIPPYLSPKRPSFLHPFRCIVVDEATQLLEPATSILLTNEVRCLVLAGDHKQLPATVLTKYGYRKSLFDRLIQSEFPSSMLKVQYRMHPAISCWPSKTFYNSLIVDGSNVQNPSYDKSWHNEFPPLSGYDVDGVEQTEEATQSKYNLHEIMVVIKIIRSLDDRIRQSKKASDNEDIKVGVISPYGAQVRAINAELNSHVFRSFSSVECSSVDAFQGKECDIIILSTVRSSIDLGFLPDMRRFNVAITRAKYSLILVGNCGALSNHPTLRDFLRQVRFLKTIHEHASPPVKISEDTVKRQITQTKELWDGTHQIFEKCKWKICFTNEFKASVVKASSSLKEEIKNKLVQLGHGKWPKYGQQPLIKKIENSLMEVIFVYSFSTYYLIWRVDVKVGIVKTSQFY